jgi:hypothetical protein
MHFQIRNRLNQIQINEFQEKVWEKLKGETNFERVCTACCANLDILARVDPILGKAPIPPHTGPRLSLPSEPLLIYTSIAGQG